MLHASLVPRISQGIVTQLLLEKQAARELDIPWETVLFCPGSDLEPYPERLNEGPFALRQEAGDPMRRRLQTNLRLRKAFYCWLAEVDDRFDVILLRYSVHDHRQARFLAHSKAFVGLVHHSFEVDELRAVDGRVGNVRARFESWLGPRSIEHADVIVGVTQEIADHQLARTTDGRTAVLVYPNGGPDEADPVADRRPSIPHFIFAASYFSTWQGLDLLIDSLARCGSDFVLHIVGNVSPQDRSAAERDSRVVLHGFLSSGQMRELAEICWMGISSLATERQGFLWACPLKVREYLSMGLPVFGGHYEVFPPDFAYYVRGRPDVSAVLEAALGWQGIPRSEVALGSTPYISKKAILESFYAELEAIVEQTTATAS